MPTGTTAEDGWVNAPTDLPGFGDIQWETMAGRDTSRAMVGGPGWGEDMSGYNPETGFTRISTGENPTPPVPGQASNKITTWKTAFNPQSPTLFIMLFALAAVGLIHARVAVNAGRAHAGAAI